MTFPPVSTADGISGADSNAASALLDTDGDLDADASVPALGVALSSDVDELDHVSADALPVAGDGDAAGIGDALTGPCEVFKSDPDPPAI